VLAPASGKTFDKWTSGDNKDDLGGVVSSPACVTNNNSSGSGNLTDLYAHFKNANAAPVCTNGSASTPEDTAVAANLSCTDADGNTLSYSIVSGPTNGVLSGTGASRTYTPNANFNGSDSFTFKANDGTVDSNVATFNITVTEVNDAPSATNDSKSVAEDGSLTFAASTLTTNDSPGPANESGQTLTVTAVGSAAHGSVSLSAGTVTYTPNADYNGPDSFSYTVTDNGTTNGASDPKTATGTVNVTVTEVNDAPTANDDTASVAEDGSVAIDVVGNDSRGPANESGQTLAVDSITAGPAHGTASVIASGPDAGKVLYTPAADYNGTDSFTYKVCDNGTTNGVADPLCDTADVSVTVTEVNDAPDAVNDTATVAEDDFVLVDVLFNDSTGPANESGQTLSVGSVGAPAHGTAVIVSGQVKYTPNANYNGSDSFTYTAKDDGTTNGANDFKTDTATVNVTITEVNDKPTAVADSKSVAEDGSLSFPASDLTGNDSPGPTNESGQTLTVLSVDPIAGETHGTVSLALDGTVTYTPAANYNGPAKFHYTVQDNGTTNGVSDPKTDEGTVNVTVNAVNDKPTITRDNASVSVNEGQTATNSGTFDDVDLGDATPDHVTISASVGTVTPNNGAKTWSWSYVPPDGPSSSTVTVTATDDAGAHDSVTFTLNVDNVAPNPTWTSYSNILFGPLVFGLTGSWSGSFTDPGADAPWTATFAWGGVNDPSQTKTYGASDPKTFSVRPNFTTAGCALTGRVTVADKDGASGSDTKTVSVGTGEFMPPMTDQPVTDKLKNGQVLPVKVRIADCNGNPISGLSPSIVLKEGDLTSEVADNSVEPIAVQSVSSADTSGFMRAADGFYIYNMRVNVAKLNTAYTIIITPNAAGYPSSMTLRHKIIATK
jgi:hypothetical protein